MTMLTNYRAVANVSRDNKAHLFTGAIIMANEIRVGTGTRTLCGKPVLALWTKKQFERSLGFWDAVKEEFIVWRDCSICLL